MLVWISKLRFHHSGVFFITRWIGFLIVLIELCLVLVASDFSFGG